MDHTAGTYFAQAREYWPKLGRFDGTDQYSGELICADNINKYVYCYSSPLKYVDKSGNIPEEDAREIIRENSEDIIKYAEMYNVDPQVVAACIYVEQTENVDWKDSLDSVIAVTIGLDTSIGIGQVKVSTVRLLEDTGYVEKTTSTWWEEKFFHISRTDKIAANLENDEKNIRYVAAYLRFMMNRWENEYPDIDDDIVIQGTLYNRGHEKRGKGILRYIFGIGNEPLLPHANPGSDLFGEKVGEYYDLMGELLEGECGE